MRISKDGCQLINNERIRQVSIKGWTPEHDDQHINGQLVLAAVMYAKYGDEPRFKNSPPSGWPWEPEWWKPSSDPIRNLAKAGALIAAEIDRLQRQSKKS